MPLTSQVIRTIVKDELGSQLDNTNKKIDDLAKSNNQKIGGLNQDIVGLNQKMDHLTEVVVDFAGQFKKFDQEQVVLSGQVSDITDRVEKLELAIN